MNVPSLNGNSGTILYGVFAQLLKSLRIYIVAMRKGLLEKRAVRIRCELLNILSGLQERGSATMRICFISHSSRNDGAERVLLETIDILQREGIECRVLVPGPGEFCRQLAGLGVQFRIISYPWWTVGSKAGFSRRVRSALNTALKTMIVAKAISRWKCDIVYTNTIVTPVGALASRLLGLPHIWHLHEFGKEDHGISFIFGEWLSHKLLERLSYRCICVSSALAGKYSQFINPSKLSIIYPSMHRALENVQDTVSTSPTLNRKAKYRCVIASRLSEGKGQKDSVLALAHLRKIGVAGELIVVGDGDLHYRRFLEETVRSNGLGEHVIFIGQVTNVLPIMQSGDAVLVCSRSEAFGRVTIEGMLAGKPVIGARTGATAELILDGVNGLLYEHGDSKDLAEKIKHLSENPSVGERMGKIGKAMAESYFTAARYREELLRLLMYVSNSSISSSFRIK